MKHLLPLLSVMLVLAGCKNMFFEKILGERQNQHNTPASVDTYTISVESLEYGAIIAKPSATCEGGVVMLQVSPKPGYRLAAGSLCYQDGHGVTRINGATGTFNMPARNVTVSAAFEKLPAGNVSVSVVTGATEHGIIIARPAFGTSGTRVHLSLVPDPGYRYREGTLGYTENTAGTVFDKAIGDTERSFELSGSNVLVSAKFEAVPDGAYTVRTGIPQNGRIFAVPEWSQPRSEVYIQVCPDPGFLLKKGSLQYRRHSDEMIAAINEGGRTFAMPSDHVLVTVEFEAAPKGAFTVGTERTAGGRVIPSPEYGVQNDPVYLHVIPDPGFRLKEKSLVIKGTGQSVDEGSRTFLMPAGHVIVHAVFEEVPKNNYTVRVNVSGCGRITASPAYGPAGTPVFLRVKPGAGCLLKPGKLWFTDTSGRYTAIDEVSGMFRLPVDHVTVNGEFAPPAPGAYSVYAEDTPNGFITAVPGSGKQNTEVFLWVVPDYGFRYESKSLAYRDQGGGSTAVPDADRTFQLPASDVWVKAKFAALARTARTVRVQPVAHGRIIPSTDFAAPRAAVTLTVIPDPGFRLKPNSLRYAGENGVIQDINKDNLRFAMPDSHVTVYGEFDAAVYSVTFDPSMSGGKITADILEGPEGTPVTLRVIADKGFRYEPGSLKYRYAQGGETAVDGKSLRFNLPAGNVIVSAKFINSTLLKNLRVNGGPPVKLIDGKTDYTVWVPGGNTASAVITFDTEPGTTVKPASGTAHPLGPFENPPVHYTVTPKDGMTKIVYTLTMIKEMIPTAPVNGGVFQRDGNRFNISEVSAFRMGICEITQAEWYTVMKYYRGAKRGDRLPVSDIRWYEAIKFCNELSILEKKTPVYSVNGETDPAKWGSVPSSGTDPAWNVVPAWNVNGYRLPTEMEWLWAAMGADFRSPGKSNTEGYGYGFAGTKIFSDADRFAWFDVNSGGDVCETGSKEANEIGLYDMSGNVREWCWDRFAFPGGSNNEDSSRYQFSIPGTRKDYTGPNTGNYRMTRGGHYSSDAKELVLSYRGGGKYYPAPFMLPHENRNEAGMRIVCRDY